MNDCLFCKIAKGEVESFTLYEDDKVKVFLDAFPNTPGHTLIIPKKHFKDFDDIDMEYLTYILETAKKIKKDIEEKLHPTSVILTQNNGEAEKIKHFHLHILPYYEAKKDLSKEEIYKLLKGEN